ncbi:MAG: ABC transporter substrate-binding protein [bacterium]
MLIGRDRAISVVIAVLALAILLSSAASAARKVSLDFMWEYGEDLDPVLKRIVEEFNKAYPDVTIKLIPFTGEPQDYEAKLLTSIAAGQPPDIFTTHDNTTYRYAVDNLIAPAPQDVADYIEREAPPVIKEGLLYSLGTRGVMYGAPWTADWVCLFYNKDMFKEAGIPGPPKTIDEMTEYARKLTKRDAQGNITRSGISLRLTGHPAGIVDKWISFLTAFGGKIVSDDNRRALFNSAEGRAAVQYYLDLLYKYKVDAVDIPHDSQAFAQKQTAMFERGPWVVPRLLATAPDLKYGVNYEVAVCPDGKAKSESIAFIDAIVVAQGSKYKSEAWDFVRWTLKPENFSKIMITRGSVPLLKSASEDPYYEEEGKFMKVFMSQAIWREPQHKRFYEIKTKLGGYLERIFYRKMDLKEALDEAEREANALLAES